MNKNNARLPYSYSSAGLVRPFLCAIFVLFLYCVTATPAHASPMADVLCTVLDLIEGNLGRGLATLAVIMIGTGACLGKTSWGMAITVAIGIVVMFNSVGVLMALGIIAGDPCL